MLNFSLPAAAGQRWLSPISLGLRGRYETHVDDHRGA